MVLSRPGGWNEKGQLGNGGTPTLVPVAVNPTGVLSGKRVVAVSAGADHNLALCSDGFMAAWGDNSRGQLGNNDTTNSSVPTAVNMAGLSGRRVIATASGAYHNLGLCSDGTLAAWGCNPDGEFGNNSTNPGLAPVVVNTVGALSGKRPIAVSAGAYHSLVLCSDGTLAASGHNGDGELGNNSTATRSLVPVAVTTPGMPTGARFVFATSGPNADFNVSIVAANSR